MNKELVSGLDNFGRLRELSEHNFNELKGIFIEVGILFTGIFIDGIGISDNVSLIPAWLRHCQQLGYC